MDIPFDIQMMRAIVANPAAYEQRNYDSECLNSIAKSANLHPAVIMAFLMTEGAETGHIRENNDHSFDVGPMQINTINWKPYHSEFGISPLSIRFDGCVNIAVGAKLIREHFDRRGRSNINDWATFYKVAADYHSRTEKHNINYQKKWIENFNYVLEVNNEQP